jgi:hypothetical protein
MATESENVRPIAPHAGIDPFSPGMESQVCELVQGERRHGLDLLSSQGYPSP